MRFNGLKSHLRLQKLRFLDAPGLFLLEIVLTGGYDLADVLGECPCFEMDDRRADGA